ncbi:hypothetical protein NL868_001335 [Shigella flexneri]|nr:hypothetical protein [Shigella flexneri]
MTKKKIEFYSTEITYKSLQSFKSIEHLNETVRYYQNKILASGRRNSHKLCALLFLLKKYSCKFFGVSYRAKKKIAADLGWNVKSVTRNVKILEEMSILKQVETKRVKSNYQSTNAIVILQTTSVPQGQVVEKSEKVDIAKDSEKEKNVMSYQEKTNSKTLSNNKEYVHNEPSYNQLDYKFVSDRVPKEFVEQVCGFAYFSKSSRIEELYKCVYLSAKKINISVQEAIPIAIESYRQLIRKMKKGNVNNPFGFFTGILKKKLKTYYVRSLFDEVFDS